MKWKFDPDFRRNPKDPKLPYCCVCQKNVKPETAILISVNWETWEAIEGHDNFEPLKHEGSFNKVIGNEYIGRDCYKHKGFSQGTP